MKFLVPLKRVFDPDTKIRLRSDGSGLETDGVKYSINPFDAIALEEALHVRDQHGTAEIVVVSIGASDCQEQLRAGLAMGAEVSFGVPKCVTRFISTSVEDEAPT